MKKEPPSTEVDAVLREIHRYLAILAALRGDGKKPKAEG
jgi:hypothetical protein